LRGEAGPWTKDPVIQEYKFTNPYRASDRVSQYLIQRVIYRSDLPSSPEDLFFRIVLFKLFNRISTWELLESAFGSVTLDRFEFRTWDKVLTRAIERGTRLYSAAYIMPSGSGPYRNRRKHRSHLQLLAQMLADNLPARLQSSRSMQSGFGLLRQYPMIGDFLAYQLITDLNYSPLTNYTEQEFVIPGPGAIDGLRKCFVEFGGLSGIELIRFVADHQEAEFSRLGLSFESLWGRPLQLIDCQNLFCEVDKYSRVAYPAIQGRSGRSKIKQRFRPSESALRVWYPPRWGLNDLIPPTCRGGPGELTHAGSSEWTSIPTKSERHSPTKPAQTRRTPKRR
jgi:5-hmdU DNA kinase-like protein